MVQLRPDQLRISVVGHVGTGRLFTADDQLSATVVGRVAGFSYAADGYMGVGFEHDPEPMSNTGLPGWYVTLEMPS